MIEYIKLCSPKIPRALGICFIIFYLTCFALLVALAVLKNMFDEFLDPIALLVYLPAFGLALALMVIVLAVLAGYFEFKLYQKAFQTPPFNQLSKIGFHQIELLKKNISRLYYEGEIAKINGFIIIATLHTKTQVCFTILSTGYARVPLDMSRTSKEAEISFNSDGITIIFPFQSFWTPSLKQISDALKSVTETMATHGCTPVTTIKQFERNVALNLIMGGLG